MDKFFQQGDVLIVPINGISAEVTKKKDNIVAEGEVTGHMHEVIGEGVEVFCDKDGNMFVSAPKGGTITHQEHHKIELPVGEFKIGIVRQYDPLTDEVNRVKD